MRRFILVMCAGSAALLLAGGVALAATVRCEGGSYAYCFGTSKDDEIRGNLKRHYVFARGGSDVVRLGGGDGDWAAGDQMGPHAGFPARQGGDTIYGGRGRDWLFGDGGDDTLHGGRGRDWLDGDSYLMISAQGADTLRGGSGDDRLDGDAGEDRLYGGEGDDHFAEVGDGAEDHLRCGEGHDTYYPPDAADHVAASCEEEVQVPPDEPPIALPPIE
jgi:hypothetical protein